MDCFTGSICQAGKLWLPSWAEGVSWKLPRAEVEGLTDFWLEDTFLRSLLFWKDSLMPNFLDGAFERPSLTAWNILKLPVTGGTYPISLCWELGSLSPHWSDWGGLIAPWGREKNYSSSFAVWYFWDCFGQYLNICGFLGQKGHKVGTKIHTGMLGLSLDKREQVSRPLLDIKYICNFFG